MIVYVTLFSKDPINVINVENICITINKQHISIYIKIQK